MEISQGYRFEKLTKENKFHLYKIKLMSTDKLIGEVLEMPSSMPLFNYEINFKNLRALIEDVNVQTNYINDKLIACDQNIKTKLPSTEFHNLEQILNKNLRFGLNTSKIADKSEDSHEKNYRKQLHEMNNMEAYAWKMARMTDILEHLVVLSGNNQAKIQEDDHRHELAIENSFRRIDEKVQASLDAMTKNINLYFTDTNAKVSTLQTDLSEHKRNTSASVEDLHNNINSKISHVQLQAAVNGLSEKVKSEMIAELKDDNMKRLAAIHEFETKLSQHMKDVELKSKSTRNSVKELTEKVAKSMAVQSFEIEKHKIYEKLSEFKNKIEDLTRGRQDFVDFRKNSFEINERVKQNIIGIEDDIKKLREKGSSFKKMEDIGSVLEALDPHLICELGSEVKLHEKEIGKLEKQVTYLENELESVRNDTHKPPEVNNGQTSDLIIKIIKEYMSNLDFEGRVKRAEKDIHDLSKRSDGVNELEKKIFMLSKDMDMGLIMKQIRKKADEDSMKRDSKIIDSKVQKLFEFYKQLRKELEFFLKLSRGGSSKESTDNPSMTTKKLHSPNCLSCTPKRPFSGRKNSSRQKFDMSLEESMDHIKNSMYVRGTY